MKKTIQGFENYLITDKGNVINRKKNKTVAQFLHRRGYPMVSLYNKGKKRNIYVHRLVAMNFVPNPENKPTINHLNENKLDNRACNLNWLTVGENNAYGTRVQRGIETRRKRQMARAEGV